MTMQLALYKGPATGWSHKVAHVAVCLFSSLRVSLRRRRLLWVPYSHSELVIFGVCWSASARDGAPGKRSGVRRKAIDLSSGRWDVRDLPDWLDEAAAEAWFLEHEGLPYDWAGSFRLCLRWLPRRIGKWFCSEACGAALLRAAASVNHARVARPEDLLPCDLEDFAATLHPNSRRA